MIKNLKLILVFALLILHTHCVAQNYQPTWESLDTRPVPQWYKDAKFGIFIHWGVYSVPAFTRKGYYAEWYQKHLNGGDSILNNYHRNNFGNKTYYQLADDFKADLFDADEWAQLFEKSGARYIVLTSKHHDGYALWPSKEASATWGFQWNAATTGPHRDLLGDLFAAVRKTTVHAGMYYSLYEWFNPLWKENKSTYTLQHAWPQMKDLINTYKPDILWTDGDWEAPDTVWKSQQFLAWLYNQSPVKENVVTMDRWGAGVRFKHGAVFTPEYQPDVDFENHYWEESRGMGYSYGYNRMEDAWDYSSAQVMVLSLIDKVSRGGNFLLDIGPDAHGKIPPIMQERLMQIGQWMKINNEAIYSTIRWREPSQWSEGKRNYKPATNKFDGTYTDLFLKLTVSPDSGYAVNECYFTYNESKNNLYALLPKWPADKKFVLRDIKFQHDTKVELLETKQVLTWQQSSSDVIISLPDFDPNKIKSQYAFVIKINNFGAFQSKPVISVNHPGTSLRSFVSIVPSEGSYRYTLDGTVPDESSPQYIKPFWVDTSCKLSVRRFDKSILPSAVTEQQLTTYKWNDALSAPHARAGLNLSFYNLKPSVAANLDTGSAAWKKITTNISLEGIAQKENYGLVYEGMIKMNKDALYNFYLASDDGSVLSIDNAVIINNDGLHGTEEKHGSVALRKGYHYFKLSFIQATGDAVLDLKYGREGAKKVKIDDNQFAH